MQVVIFHYNQEAELNGWETVGDISPYSKYRIHCEVTDMFNDDAYGKTSNDAGYDTIFMEWKYWLLEFSEKMP